MKTILLILFFNFSVIIAQDTSIVKYLPLKTGNVWIYNYSGSSGSGKIKMSVTGFIINNGHKYFNLDLNGTPCSCSFYSYSPFLVQLNNGIRIDSSNGNIYFNTAAGSCTWNPNEMLLDSLKMLPNIFTSNSCYFTSCQDTNIINMFGNNYRTKYVGQNVPTYFKFRRYAKYIGLVSSVMGCYAGSSCTYTLQGCIIDGVLYGDTSFPVGINVLSTETPEKFSLSQNYPNPFNPVTKIKFSIPQNETTQGAISTRLIIYDALGKELAILVNQQLQPGTYEADWDASSYPSGVYYYKLKVETSQRDVFTETKKMVLIK